MNIMQWFDHKQISNKPSKKSTSVHKSARALSWINDGRFFKTESDFEKAKRSLVGDTHIWSDGKQYQKQIDGQWKPIGDARDIAAAIKPVISNEEAYNRWQAAKNKHRQHLQEAQKCSMADGDHTAQSYTKLAAKDLAEANVYSAQAQAHIRAMAEAKKKKAIELARTQDQAAKAATAKYVSAAIDEVDAAAGEIFVMLDDEGLIDNYTDDDYNMEQVDAVISDIANTLISNTESTYDNTRIKLYIDNFVDKLISGIVPQYRVVARKVIGKLLLERIDD